MTSSYPFKSRSSQPIVPNASEMLFRFPFWREAASLIITAKNSGQNLYIKNIIDIENKTKKIEPCTRNGNDYYFLMLKRNMNASFMAGKFVFPGGVIGTCDINDGWVTHFAAITGQPFENTIKCIEVNGDRPLIMSNTNDWSVPPSIAFRICAIRETFEESGVLLARCKDDFINQDCNKFRPLYCKLFTGLSLLKLKEYRKKVQQNEELFLQMCIELDIVPDVWSLNEWSNALTPVFAEGSSLIEAPKKPYRFDTMFYQCCLNEIPNVTHQMGEMIDSKWIGPKDIYNPLPLRSFIPLIQLWEMGAISNQKTLKDVAHFCRSREAYGVCRQMYIFVVCTDGIMEIAKGDELYPEIPDFEGRKPVMVINKTIEESLKECQHMFRIVMNKKSGGGITFYHRNVLPSHGHLMPKLLELEPKSSL